MDTKDSKGVPIIPSLIIIDSSFSSPPRQDDFYGLRQNWAYEAPNEFTFLYVMLTATKEKSTKIWKENDWLYTFIFTISRLTIFKNPMRKSCVQGRCWKKWQWQNDLNQSNSISNVDSQQLIMLSHIFLLSIIHYRWISPSHFSISLSSFLFFFQFLRLFVTNFLFCFLCVRVNVCVCFGSVDRTVIYNPATAHSSSR